MTFSMPNGEKVATGVKTMMGLVRRIVQSEGFAINDDKTRVHRAGGRQSVTGLVVNGDGDPRVSRKLRRQLRSAIHKLKTGKPLKKGETVARLAGYAAFVYMTNPEQGKKMLGDLMGFDGAP